ncbi:endonuclease/exonuclease/phosphatase family protein [Flammeovirgaceae bacterium SG7u.111]|nr:endonuclease/exonuclease/phosphatase family protein [Flammeovirgaceae bacterium SG7u.132]WPO36108.1 endonuclease/exonuclease/phosphatase family protein [Flammeovirgaceae bacterium SG7u.111]
MQTYVSIGLTVLAVLPIIATLASTVKLPHWWLRVFDFPRLQITVSLFLFMVLGLIFYSLSETWHFIVLGGLFISFYFQLTRIAPYTPLAKKQVVSSLKGADVKNTINILVSNVLTSNKESEKLIAQVNKLSPHILLTLESDKWWEEKLDVLEKDFPYTVKIPLDNLYGMHLYSNLELKNTQVNYLVQDDIPSIFAKVVLKSGAEIDIYCVHPRPPAPSESSTSIYRDAELLIVGQKVQKSKEPTLVFGDLNDVAWSYTTRLFRKVSGLLDPRIGRGVFSTFHADKPLLRWPLDHIFHSKDFELVNIQRLNSIGSDHFPLFVSLYLDPKADENVHQASKEDNQEAKEIIQNGHEEAKS